MSNRPNYAHGRRARRTIATALPIVRAAYGCRCAVEVRHGSDGQHRIGHDTGCPLIGRSQIVIDLRGHR